MSLEPDALQPLPTCRGGGSVVGGTARWRLSLRAVWWCGCWGAGGVLGRVVEHAWRGIQGARVCTCPCGQRRPVRPWHVVAHVCVVDDDFDTDHLNIVLCVLRAFWLATATQSVSLEPEALRLPPTCRGWGTVLDGTSRRRLSLRAVWWCGRWGAGGVLGCVVKHARRAISDTHVCLRPSA